MTGPVPILIRESTIRLGQFLKLADAVDQGSDVKALLASQTVTVNGQVEPRRGRQLSPGDVVVVGATTYLIANDQ